MSKKLYLAATAITMIATQAYATEASTNTTTGVTTGVSTDQNSGLTIGDKAHIKGDVYTGSNTADTRVSTDVSNRSSADATQTEKTNTEVTNHSYNKTRGKGHKYGQDNH